MKKLVLLVGVLLFSVTAYADSFTLIAITGQTLGGYDIGPWDGYYKNWEGMRDIMVVSDDFNNYDVNGKPYDVYRSDLSTGDVSQTLYGAEVGLRGYEEAFWLSKKMTWDPNDHRDIGLQLAIWSIFAANNPTLQQLIAQNGYTGTVADYITEASSEAPSNPSNYKGDFILSPTGPSGQELFWETPEPSSLWLLGSGIIGIAGFTRRKHLW